MDWKQFITDLVSSIAWPAVAIAFIVMLKSELVKILQRLAHLKYKDLELDFDRVKQHAKELHLDVTEEKAAIESPVFASLEDQILDAVERAPSAAILLAWSGLETAMAAAVARLAISADPPSSRSPSHNIEMLVTHAQLPKNYAMLLHEMRTLRNRIAHQLDEMLLISRDQALNYANTAIDLMKQIKSYGHNDG